MPTTALHSPSTQSLQPRWNHRAPARSQSDTGRRERFVGSGELGTSRLIPWKSIERNTTDFLSGTARMDYEEGFVFLFAPKIGTGA